MSKRIYILCSMFSCLVLLGVPVLIPEGGTEFQNRAVAEAGEGQDTFAALIDQHCIACHNSVDNKGDLDIEQLVDNDFMANRASWEQVLRKLSTRQMPPADAPRPSEAAYELMVGHLDAALDAAARERLNPGRTETFRHLTRTEYQNAIRDLLALEIDAAQLLPADESSHGFDHITVGDLPPALLNRYVQAAQKISRLAVGSGVTEPDGTTYRLPADLTQEQHVHGLPLGTRGGALLRHTFPRDGEYEIQIRLTRDRDEQVEGLHGVHDLQVLIDRGVVARFEVAPPRQRVANHFDDAQLRVRVQVQAGPRDLGVTFVDNGNPLQETRREPLNVHFNAHRHPRLSPAIYQVSVTGPFLEPGADPQITDTPSRRLIFTTYPEGEAEHEEAARAILSTLARRAYRRPVDDADLAKPMRFFREFSEQDGFEAGIEMAISAILTSPHFLLKIEWDPDHVPAAEAYRISDIELASRLSFFLWSSIPDDELLAVAERGALREPEVLEAQVRRMLADEKAKSLATNFAGQWLHLRNLDAQTPDARLFPDFDDNLRQAMRRETELHLLELVRGDRSVLDLIRADYTFLNERLAKHYGIDHVYGSRFRRVDLPEGSQRGGLLRQGSILTVTSYATRTSPVIRGNWVLENMLGTPAPPPPADIPSLDNVMEAGLTVRERLARHREDPSCAQCHNLMDPIGFSLERYDAVGRYRETDSGWPVDASGRLPGRERFVGAAGLERGLLDRPELFAAAMTEKLLTFALGRGLEYFDGPSVRRIVRDAAASDYRFSAVVLGIVTSEPFLMRRAQ